MSHNPADSGLSMLSKVVWGRAESSADQIDPPSRFFNKIVLMVWKFAKFCCASESIQKIWNFPKRNGTSVFSAKLKKNQGTLNLDSVTLNITLSCYIHLVVSYHGILLQVIAWKNEYLRSQDQFSWCKVDL